MIDTPWLPIVLAVLAGMIVGSTVARFIAKRMTASWATEQATVLLLSAIAGGAIGAALGFFDEYLNWYEASLWAAIGGAASGWLYPVLKRLVKRRADEQW